MKKVFGLLIIGALFSVAAQAEAEPGSWEDLAVFVAGFVAPFVVQFLRSLLGESYSNNAISQAIAIVVCVAITVGAGWMTGDIGTFQEVLMKSSMVFAVATVVYKQLQDKFEGLF